MREFLIFRRHFKEGFRIINGFLKDKCQSGLESSWQNFSPLGKLNPDLKLRKALGFTEILIGNLIFHFIFFPFLGFARLVTYFVDLYILDFSVFFSGADFSGWGDISKHGLESPRFFRESPSHIAGRKCVIGKRR